jgi:NADH-ubiquinone oxidoreductase chain 3
VFFGVCFIIVCLSVSFVVYCLAQVMAIRGRAECEKSSAFECGFESVGRARVPFSLRFFLLAVVFLIFDIEVVLVSPLPMVMFRSLYRRLLVGIIWFLFLLLIGLLYE